MFRIVYDDDVYGARIMARDVAHLSDEDEPDLAFHVIAIQTQSVINYSINLTFARFLLFFQ